MHNPTLLNLARLVQICKDVGGVEVKPDKTLCTVFDSDWAVFHLLVKLGELGLVIDASLISTIHNAGTIRDLHDALFVASTKSFLKGDSGVTGPSVGAERT